MANDAAILSAGGCCAPPAVPMPDPPAIDRRLVHDLGGGRAHIDFLVPEMHCAACLTGIEGALSALPGVEAARANLTTRRVGIDFDRAAGDPEAMRRAIAGCGYTARPFDAFALGEDGIQTELLRAMAVAGFAAGNIMLLSVSVWAGAPDATRQMFHWISALIALPAIAYSGQPFFRSAWRGLRSGRLNMDFPISLGVTLAAGMSFYETLTGGRHAWFDASVTLLFLLLVGRYLDHRMRDVARSAAARLLSLVSRAAVRLGPGGRSELVPVEDIAVGDLVCVAAGERVAIDGTVASGASDVDRSMLTGEPQPEPVKSGDQVFAGTMNLTGALVVRAAVAAKDTLLSDIVRLTEQTEKAQSALVRLADRASAFYAPAVHILAAATLIGWLWLGAGAHAAVMNAVAVLIITCPCALGLAVPAVQVVASDYLLRRGVMMKEGSALEKLAVVDTVVFDKTGTLTAGEPELTATDADEEAWSVAAALGAASRHPLAKALARAARGRATRPAEIAGIVETPGSGMEGRYRGDAVRLGRGDWAGAEASSGEGLEIWVRIGSRPPAAFRFDDALRADAAAVVAALKADGHAVLLLSGDRPAAVAALARRVGIETWRAALRPDDKAEAIRGLAAAGRSVLMVGDGLNDAPALASALLSMSPSSGSDITQSAAQIVFTGRNLEPVATSLRIGRRARRLMLQNFALAIGYNAFAVPVAMLGHATPLIAAVAMSTSSVIVTLNALRLARTRAARAPVPAAPRLARVPA